MKHTSVSSPNRTRSRRTPAAEAPVTLWLIRHAEVEPRYQSIFGGRIDMELSERGHRQASALALYLRQKRFDALYASPMRRVQQTLAPLLGSQGLPQPVILSELREVDFGDWTGLSWDQVEEKFGVSAFTWLDQLEQDRIPNAECAEKLRRRLQPCLHTIARAHPGQQVAVLCHGGVIRMILAILTGWRFSAMGSIEVDYASISQVSVAPGRIRLNLLNFTPWRDLQPPPGTGSTAAGAASKRRRKLQSSD